MVKTPHKLIVVGPSSKATRHIIYIEREREREYPSCKVMALLALFVVWSNCFAQFGVEMVARRLALEVGSEDEPKSPRSPSLEDSITPHGYSIKNPAHRTMQCWELGSGLYMSDGIVRRPTMGPYGA